MFLFTVMFALLLLGVCLRKGECCPIFSSGHRAVGSGETSLCLCNMIKELTPDLLGVGFFFFFFFFLHLSPQLFGDSRWAVMSLRAK